MTAALLLVATGGLGAGILTGRGSARLWLGTTLASVSAALAAAVTVLMSGDDWEWRSGFLLGGEPLYFRLDAISAYFLILLCVIAGAGAVYGREYWTDTAHPRSARSGRVWWSVLVLCLGAGAARRERPAFSHRVGAVHAERVFSRSRWIGSGARCARRAGFTWRLRTRPCSPVRLLRHAGRAHRKLGTRTDARPRRSWRRCSGWRCSALA